MSGTPKQLPPEAYARTFVNHPEGAQILDELVARFGRNPYVPGGLEGDRETCKRAGENRVVHFILARINQAAGVDDANAEE